MPNHKSKQEDNKKIRDIRTTYNSIKKRENRLPFTPFCKLFSHTSKPKHTLLASKRRPIDLQKMPFKTLTNALLKSN